jgi:iron complex outermembrane receptor protein
MRRDLGLSYRESTAQSDNYSAASPFKASGPAALLRDWLDGDEVGSSAYDGATNGHRPCGPAQTICSS